MKNIFKRIALLLLFVTASCDLDGDLENPNEVSVSGADIDLIMNGVQLDFADFFNQANIRVGPLVRMQAMTGGYRYQNAILPQDMDLLWTLAYQNVLINIKTLIPAAEAKNLTTHVAVAKILEAYVYLTLADIFGDVPLTAALNGGGGDFNPVADSGEDVYDYAIGRLEEARIELAKTGTDAGGALNRDIYYGGDRALWTTLANTIELKAWLNLSMLTSRKAEADGKMTALIAGDDLIDDPEESFTYKYGTTTVPVSRHPLYNQYYGSTAAAASGYICNYFLYELFNGRGLEDPRWRYYFYRQVGSIAEANAVDPKAVGCSVGAIPDHYANGNYVFCTFDPGFYGRDHGDASGTPPDSPVITCAGVYPAAGKLDNTSLANTSFRGPTVRGDGGNGAGIQPIWMSFFTGYLIAEIQSRSGNDAAAKITLSATIQSSIDEIRDFATSTGQELTPGREPDNAAYIAAVESAFDAASNKLDVIGREFYVACWGNGVEAYNNYRRTSAPRNPQPTLQLNPGPFFRSVVYPAVYANLNSNATQKDVSVTNKVFWDTNPDNLN